MSNSLSNTRKPGRLFLLFVLLLVVLGFLFASSLKPGQALFNNDGPLGAQVSQIYRLPGAFLGIWNDLYWLGAYNGNYSANFTGTLLWLLGPISFNKFYVPVSLLILGLSAGLFFKRLGFTTTVCVLAGMAAALNGNFFSNACWGLATRALCLASTFLALAALQIQSASQSAFRSVVLTILAGLAVGMAISEGADNGALFSLFVAGFAFIQNVLAEGSPGSRVAKGVARVAVMAVFAALLAAQTLNVFVNTSVKGIVNVQQEGMSPEQKWDWATQWSLPKLETLRVIIPGLFGYRLDTDKGGNYWGTVGQQPGWETHHQGFPRHSGAGEYAGVLVVLMALWAVVFSLAKGRSLTPALSAGGGEGGRKTGTPSPQSSPPMGARGPFSETERKMIWYWSVAGLIALVLAWGRHAPFYILLYKLPYFSTIRNPMKFMHVVHLCLMVLFAYGLQGLSRLYLDKALAAGGGLFDHLKAWWAKANVSEKRWTFGMIGAVVLSAVAFLVYSSAEGSLVKHLLEAGFGDPGLAKQIAKFSAHEVGLFVVFLAGSAAIVLLIQSGAFAGNRAKWAALLLGIVLVVDLCRANAPWIVYYNWREKYASNPVLDVLRDKPYEHRVSIPPFQLDRVFGLMQQVYQVEWTQHHFPFYGIQSLDIPQEPRMPADKAAYRGALSTNLVRLWELTNTRYLFGVVGLTEALNNQLDGGRNRFRPVMAFDFYQAGENVIGVKTNAAGRNLLIEFTGALPRVKLYANWQAGVDDTNALATLASPNFNPHESVLVADSIPAPPAGATNTPALKAEITSYAPKKLTVRTSAPGTPAVLLLNDKWDEGWRVTVDGKPAPLLRANFLMQGIALPAGDHTVQFTFAPRSTIFFVSLAAVLLGILLCGLLFVIREPSPAAEPQTK